MLPNERYKNNNMLFIVNSKRNSRAVSISTHQNKAYFPSSVPQQFYIQ